LASGRALNSTRSTVGRSAAYRAKRLRPIRQRKPITQEVTGPVCPDFFVPAPPGSEQIEAVDTKKNTVRGQEFVVLDD